MPLPRQSFRVPSTQGVQLCVNAWPRQADVHSHHELPVEVLVHPHTVMGGRQVDDITAVCRFAVKEVKAEHILMLGSSAGEEGGRGAEEVWTEGS